MLTLLVCNLGCVPSGKTPLKLSSVKRDAAAPATPAPMTPLDAGRSPAPPADAGIVAPPSRDAAAPTPPPPRPPAPPDAGQTPPTPPPPDMCTEGPNKPLPSVANVYYGTPEPTHVPLSQGQIYAVGDFNGCSGTLIAPTWILSASHCGFRTGRQFCIGRDPSNPNVCFRTTRAVDHPRADMTILEIGEDARNRAPWVEPVPIFTDNLDSSWIGTLTEAGGYGRQENGRSGEREFTAQPIVRLGSGTVTIDGQGQRGVCFGDSGGPLFVIASDGSPRLAGVLSNGDSSCVGRDNFTRVDTYRSWIEGYTGPTVPPGPQPCGSVTTEGSCSTDRRTATYCGGNNELQVDRCDSNQVCGRDTRAQGFRCIAQADDPCRGLTYSGECNGNTLSWCDDGRLKTRDCEACNEACIPMRGDVGNFCIPGNCGSLTFLGRCNGDTVEWCNREGQRETRNCRNGCGFVNSETGYWCQ